MPNATTKSEEKATCGIRNHDLYTLLLLNVYDLLVSSISMLNVYVMIVKV